MTHLHPMEMAYVHREAYSALIRGATRGGKGARAGLARAAGISRQHLNMILTMDELDRGMSERWPSPAVAAQICSHLPLPPELRQQALQHLMNALQLKATHDRVVQDSRYLATTESVWMVRDLAHKASHAMHPEEARHLYRFAVTQGKRVLEVLSPPRQAMEYMEVCLCLHDMLGALDRHAEALMYARFGNLMMDESRPPRLSMVSDRRREVEVNLLRALGVSYNGLGLPKKALEYFARTRETPAYKHNPENWIAHLARDLLAAWVKEPRFAISEMESIVSFAEAQMTDDQRGVPSLLLQAKMAECYIVIGDRKDKAGKLLIPVMEAAEHTSMGMLSRVIIYRTYAHYCRSQRNWQEFDLWAHKALSLAQEAGLDHQLRTIQADLLQS